MDPDQSAHATLLPDVDVNAFASTDDAASEVIQGLKMAGACIVRHLYTEDTMKKLDEEIEPHVSDFSNTAYFQKSVVTATGLASKSETYAFQVIANPLWTKVRDYFLTYKKGTFWISGQQMSLETSVQLGSATALELRPGAEAQGLHRDDLVHSGFNTGAEEYSLGRDVCLTFFAACHKTHRKNGATRIVPGSHLWDYNRPPPAANDGSVVDAEINRGDALIILGSVFHAAGANTTETERRRCVTCGVCCSYLRQTENQYLANDLEKIRRLPTAIKRFIGYELFPPARQGWVNWGDPLPVIDPDFESQPTLS